MIRAVSPCLSCTLGSTSGALRRSFTISVWPFSVAINKAVLPISFCMSGFAPASSKALAIGMNPLSNTIIKGVLPNLSCKLRLAFFSSNNFTMLL